MINKVICLGIGIKRVMPFEVSSNVIEWIDEVCSDSGEYCFMLRYATKWHKTSTAQYYKIIN